MKNVQIPQELFMKLLRYHMLYDRGVSRSCINGRQGKVADVKTEVFGRHREGCPDSGHPW